MARGHRGRISRELPLLSLILHGLARAATGSRESHEDLERVVAEKLLALNMGKAKKIKG
jgi:hypothetical protein